MKRIQKKASVIVLIGAFFLSTLALFSCKNERPELTSEEKETAKKEISAQIGKIIEGAGQFNIEMAISPYSNSPDFLIVNANRTFFEYS